MKVSCVVCAHYKIYLLTALFPLSELAALKQYKQAFSTWWMMLCRTLLWDSTYPPSVSSDAVGEGFLFQNTVWRETLNSFSNCRTPRTQSNIPTEYMIKHFTKSSTSLPAYEFLMKQLETDRGTQMRSCVEEQESSWTQHHHTHTHTQPAHTRTHVHTRTRTHAIFKERTDSGAYTYGSVHHSKPGGAFPECTHTQSLSPAGPTHPTTRSELNY